MRRRLTICLLVIAAQSVARPSGAEEQGDVAARAFARGRALFQQKRYVAAIAAFEEAYRLRPHFMVQCSIARCHENMNQYILAVTSYRRCLAEGAAASAMAEKVRASLEAAEAQISRVSISSPRAGDEIFVDGQAAGVTPRQIPLNPGEHMIEVRREGAKPARTMLKALGGEQLAVQLTPFAGVASVRAPQRSAVPPLAENRPHATRRRLAPLWFWTASGVTAALGVAAVALGVQALRTRAAYEESPTRHGLDEFKGMRTATNVMWGLAAAAAASSTVLFFYTDFAARERRSPRRAALVGIGLRRAF